MAQQARASVQQPLPQEAYGYAGMYQLGNPVAVYRVSFRSSITLGIVSLLLAGLFTAVALFGYLGNLGLLMMGVLTLACLVAGAYYLILNPMLHSGWRIYACTDGFLFLKGTEAIPCRWDQVAFVWQRVVRYYRNGVYTGTSYKYTVQRSDGVRLVMTELFRNVGKLGDQLQREVTARLAPQALAAVKAGQTLPFGPFSLSLQGVGTPRGFLPWGEVQQVSASRGMITIQRRGQRVGKPFGAVDRVPNFYIFLFVAETLLKGKG